MRLAISGPSPVSRQFIGGLIRKVKKVVRSVANVTGKVASEALSAIGPILDRLKAVVRPLLRRVLAIATTRLPPTFRRPARSLAERFGLAESEPPAGVDRPEELLRVTGPRLASTN